MRWKSHVRFGGRPGETDHWKRWHGAPGRSHLANAAIDDVRRRVQRETLGHRGRKDDPLFGARRLFTRGYERLSDRQLARLEHALRWGDPYDEVGGALAVKEQLRTMYSADTLARARQELAVFYDLAATAGTPEVVRLAKTIRRWETQVL